MADLNHGTDLALAIKSAWRSQREIAKAVGISERHLRRLCAGDRPCPPKLHQRIIQEARQFPESWSRSATPAVQEFLVDLSLELGPLLTDLETQSSFTPDTQLATMTARHVADQLKRVVERRAALTAQDAICLGGRHLNGSISSSVKDRVWTGRNT